MDQLNYNFTRELDIDFDNGFKKSKVHVRLQMRTGKKSLTTISGMDCSKQELELILRPMRKMFNTNGTILKDDEFGLIIQLQGDMRDRVKEYLVRHEGYESTDIIMHGS
jgi:translation initiation factor 1